MFTDKEITAYHNIKAPKDLCQKITKARQRSKRLVQLVTAVAACFIFMISGLIVNSQSNIVVNGQKLKGSIEFYDTTSSLGRTVSSIISVPIEIKVSRSTKISVTDGFISVNGGAPSKEIEIISSAIIWWEVEPNENNNVFEMRISDKKGVQKVALKYENAKITVTKEKEK